MSRGHADRAAAGGNDGAPALPLCGSQDLAVAVRWERDDTGLRGQVIARNVSARACRLAGKPAIAPLGADGVPLPVGTSVTLEFMEPGYVVLQSGQRAAAAASWSEWCGQPASSRAQVSWDGGAAVAEVRGPVQPGCSQGRSGNLSSSWFRLIE
jgi:Protein of unknown function (DUF4232)